MGHIPKNFEEKEIRGFFEQFGEILRVRLSRSKKVRAGTPPVLRFENVPNY